MLEPRFYQGRSLRIARACAYLGRVQITNSALFCLFLQAKSSDSRSQYEAVFILISICSYRRQLRSAELKEWRVGVFSYCKRLFISQFSLYFAAEKIASYDTHCRAIRCNLHL